MSQPAGPPDPTPGGAEDRIPRSRVWAWASWDWGSSAFTAVMTTFVFAVYLTDKVGDDVPGPLSATNWLAFAVALAGLAIGLLAPVLGQRADDAGRRKRSLLIWTTLVVATMLACVLVRDDYHYLWWGLLMLGLGTIFFELANVPYYAMLSQVSTPKTVGRVSGFGWAAGYLGGIVLLLVLNFGFIAGDGGLLELSEEDGFNIRMAVLVATIWFAAFAIPTLLKVPEVPAAPDRPAKVPFTESYRRLFRHVRTLWREDRPAVQFLIASALFRDGLAGVFTFGAILANTVYGLDDSTVLLFGVAANVCAAIAAFIGGRFDDRYGPRPVIVVSLVSMMVAGLVLLCTSGPLVFWIFGLFLTVFVGPAQSCARSYVSRIAVVGREGEMFGLYQTTGRAASFLSPALFGLFVLIFDADRAGIVGLIIVLGAGLVFLLRVPADPRTAARAGVAAASSADARPGTAE